MNTRALVGLLFVPILLGSFFCGLLHAEELSCGEVSSIAKMARARSTKLLADETKKAGDSYRARIVSAARQLELNPNDRRTAAALLDLIPKDDEQETVWMTFGDSLCDTESTADMNSLSRLGDRLSHDLAKAVMLVPSKMQAYVAFAFEAVKDPHNDYALQMRVVCRANHIGFKKAIADLPEKDRRWFVGHILKPDGCRTLAFPEAD